MKLELKDKQFYLEGEKFQLISGAMHYFRIHPEYWEDRLRKLKACGMNTVETYVPWNMHEPVEGQFDFDGIADVERYIQIASDLGLYVIVRPSPYICAEWEFGGLPAWLLAEHDLRLRTADPIYLEKVKAYYEELIPRFVPFQTTNGGKLLAFQIENEYGSYGNDKEYLGFLRDIMIDLGIDVPLFTSDGGLELMLTGGTIDGAFATVNFGSRPDENFEALDTYFPEAPHCVMEFWNGWFDHWKEHHHTRGPQDAADTFKKMLSDGTHVNFYMFHGGTNFGFWNGANHGNGYEPTITSYDYDAPLSEAGDLTKKYHLVRDIITEHTGKTPEEPPADTPKQAYGKVDLTESIGLFDVLEQISEPIHDAYPRSMEQYGQGYGHILYRTTVKNVSGKHKLRIQDVHDRAVIFVDGEYQGVIDRWMEDPALEIEVKPGGTKVDILVENMGRVNYGAHLYDPKGITYGALLDYQYLSNWTVYPLPLDNLEAIDWSGAGDPKERGAAFYRGTFTVDNVADTFMTFAGWEKGQAYINGFNLGRYWEAGPQRTLYVPAPILKEGENELILFEVGTVEKPEVEFLAEPDLGPTDPPTA